MKKRAVVVIYSPRELIDFIWFYCLEGKKYEWVAVCAPYGKSDTYTYKLCKKAQIFSDVLRDNRNFMQMPLLEKAAIFVKMLCYFVCGQRKKYCKKIIDGALHGLDYDAVVIPCDLGIFPGAFLSEAKEKEIYIMEDGSVDYLERKKGEIFRRLNNPYEILGFALAKMGYANISQRYRMKNTKYCIKYCTHPERMLYREYKELRKIDWKDAENQEFNSLIKRIFDLNEQRIECDAILFTAALSSFVDDETIVTQILEEYINSNYRNKKIVIKRHPRDKKTYHFAQSIEVHELDANLPAELLVKNIDAQKVIYMYPSTVGLTFGDFYKDYCVLYFKIIEKNDGVKQGICNYKYYFEKGIQTCFMEKQKVLEI